MNQPDSKDDLDAFFSAARSKNPDDIETVAATMRQPDPRMEDLDDDAPDFEGKFVAYDPKVLGREIVEGSDPLVLIPAHIHSYVPWWGWLTIALGLVVLALGVILMPSITLSRLASGLGDSNQVNVLYAMRRLIMRGDERTVKKLYDMASSPDSDIVVRLRAVDTMSLIDRVPEVDRSLLRLELAGSTDDRVREAAIAARKQRDAVRARRGGVRP